MSRLYRSTAGTAWTVRDDPYVLMESILTPLAREDIFWPPSRLMGSGNLQPPTDYNPYIRAQDRSGSMRHVGFTGITRDAASAALGGCVVQLFHTTDDLFVQEAVSDPSGNYMLSSNYADAHYIVAYLAGTPDVAGTTLNTLVGT